MGHKTAVFRNSLIVAVLLLLASGSAFAQATRTWVSGVGDDANPCSRTAPCKTFAGAISKTATGGIINCIDPGGFGAVTITKSMEISCKHVEGSSLASGTTGIIINGAGAVVVLRGLDIDGSSTTAPGINGIRFLQGASLTVEDCIVRDFNSGTPNGHGILVNNTSLTAKINIIRTDISGNGSGDQFAGAGIQIAPTGSGSADVTVIGSSLSSNLNGFRADSTGTTGSIDVSISDTTVSNSTFNGIAAVGPTTAVRMMLSRVVVANNGGQGLRAEGAAALIRTGSSSITGNAFGLNTISGGLLQSYGNNQLNGNTSDGGFTAVALK